MGAEVIPVSPAPDAAAPATQSMGDDDLLSRIMNPQQGLLVRQKLDIMEAFLPYQKENKYKVAAIPADKIDKNDPSDWEDKTFKKALKKGKIMTIKEKSECIQQIFCGARRGFEAKVYASKKVANGQDTKLGKLIRPFKCSINLGCIMLNPQEMDVENAKGEKVGHIEHDFRCLEQMMNKNRWKVENANGDVQYYIVDDMCCNENMFAPTFCCAQRTLQILDTEEQEVGTLIDYFPGCTTRGCLGTADNFKLMFPIDADANMKLTLLGANILIDYMVFEKSEDDQNNGDHE